MRLNFDANLDALDGMYVFLDRFNEIVAETGEQTAAEITPELLAELQKQPPARTANSPKIEWTSDKQRRAYFATDGFGAGIPYQRTGGLAAAWRVVTQTTATGFRMVVENPNRAARFVYGSLAKNVGAASRFQQKFHKTTGWITAAPVVHEWMDIAQSLYRVRLNERIAGLGVTIKRRAVTPRLRRR